MSPLTATMEDIKAYQEKVEKDKITLRNLSRCSRCHHDALFFKIHAYRERRFLIIVQMVVKTVFCTLVRFRCPNCGKTFTSYPDFAIPHKHYTFQTILSFSRSYVKDDQKTYEDAIMTGDGVPEASDSGQSLAPSTIHRWIVTLANLIVAYQKALSPSLHKKPSHFFTPSTIPSKKYKTRQRRNILLRCRWFFTAEPFLQKQLSPSLQ